MSLYIRCDFCRMGIPDTRAYSCPHCGAPVSASPSFTTPDGGIALQSFLCPDPVAGIPAFRLLKPAHWVLEGGPFWTMRSPFLPGDIAFRVHNPHEDSALELIPRQMFAWQGGDEQH